MRRMEALLGPMGLVLVGLMLLGALVGILRRRTRKSKSTSFDGLDVDGEATDIPQDKTLAYASVEQFLRSYVVPWARMHPGWQRLDGVHGLPGKTVGTFVHGDLSYNVNGASEIPALLKLLAWIEENPGADPFATLNRSGGRSQLRVRQEVGIENPKSIIVTSV